MDHVRRGVGTALALAALLAAVACGDDTVTSSDDDGDTRPADPLSAELCTLPDSLIADAGLAPNAIPALTDPLLVEPGSEGLRYLHDDTRVLGVAASGEPRAYPHNILWWHEVINETTGSYAVTFCPLTGSGLVFDRTTLDGRPDVGVSGLLFANNLVMYDRETERLIGPQMSVTGKCGDFRGDEPELVPVIETSWERWRELHPTTTVVSARTGWDRNYRIYPYGDYDIKENPVLLFPMETDRSRPPKERVLGVRAGEAGGVAYPFDELDRLGPTAVVNDEVGTQSRPVAVFYERRDGRTATAWDRRVDDRTLTFETAGDGWMDAETGTLWDLAGRAVEGPLVGERLTAVSDAYVAFWFAWRHFQPDSRTWTAGS